MDSAVHGTFRIKKIGFFLAQFFLITSFGILVPGAAMALGLGEAGSLTLEGLLIGVVVLSVIFLVFMGLLLMARARELNYVEKHEEATSVHFKPEDVMNMSAEEINDILRERSSTNSK